MKPKLTLRDLFWLVLVAGVVTSWGLDHTRLSRQIKRLEGEWHYNPGMGLIFNNEGIIDGCFQELAEDSSSP